MSSKLAQKQQLRENISDTNNISQMLLMPESTLFKSLIETT
jgi:hypothetical protein